MGNWRSNVRVCDPYTPGEQPKIKNIIKLNTNENPYPPAPEAARALRAIDTDLLRRYPDPTCSTLVEAIADRYGLDKEEVFVGVGSDDVLAMSFMTFFNSSKPVLFADITYSFYDVWAKMLRIPYEQIPLDEDWSIVPEDYLRENGGIVIANPNAPTGKLLAVEKIEQIIAANPDSVVIVDEAYIDFGGTSVLPLIHKYENLLVVQTFSKSRSLAGLRIGMAFGCKELIHYLETVKYAFNSYTMNTAALAAGAASVRNEAYFRETTGKIIATRERVKPLLRELGFSFEDSMSNFIFARHESLPAEELFEALKREGIFVRHFSAERIRNFLRITIGTDQEMDTLLDFLRRYLKR